MEVMIHEGEFIPSDLRVSVQGYSIDLSELSHVPDFVAFSHPQVSGFLFRIKASRSFIQGDRVDLISQSN